MPCAASVAGSAPRAGVKCSARCTLVCRSSCVLYDHHLDVVPYDRAWAWQKRRARQIADATPGDSRPDQALLILQHAPTYTLGTRSSLANLKFSPEQPPCPLYRTERGGEVTYHGPGQLTLYPILDLRYYGKDLHVYLRSLEEVVITALREVSGIEGFRIEGLSGVWTESGKIAAVGVRATKWVSYHGIAFNVNPDLSPFDHIIPCGIADAEVTSVTRHLTGLSSSHDAGGPSAGPTDALLTEYAMALQEAFEDVFNVQLVPGQIAWE